MKRRRRIGGLIEGSNDVPDGPAISSYSTLVSSLRMKFLGGGRGRHRGAVAVDVEGRLRGSWSRGLSDWSLFSVSIPSSPSISFNLSNPPPPPPPLDEPVGASEVAPPQPDSPSADDKLPSVIEKDR